LTAASLPSSTRPTSCTLPTSSGGSSQRSPATCHRRAGATQCATARLGHHPPRPPPACRDASGAASVAATLAVATSASASAAAAAAAAAAAVAVAAAAAAAAVAATACRQLRWPSRGLITSRRRSRVCLYHRRRCCPTAARSSSSAACARVAASTRRTSSTWIVGSGAMPRWLARRRTRARTTRRRWWSSTRRRTARPRRRSSSSAATEAPARAGTSPWTCASLCLAMPHCASLCLTMPHLTTADYSLLHLTTHLATPYYTVLHPTKVHALDLESWCWSKIERIKGPAPKPRADHAVRIILQPVASCNLPHPATSPCALSRRAGASSCSRVLPTLSPSTTLTLGCSPWTTHTLDHRPLAPPPPPAPSPPLTPRLHPPATTPPSGERRGAGAHPHRRARLGDQGLLRLL